MVTAKEAREMLPTSLAQAGASERDKQDRALKQLLQGQELEAAGLKSQAEQARYNEKAQYEREQDNIKNAIAQRKLELDIQKAAREGNALSKENKVLANARARANITGYDIADPEVIPSAQDAEQVKKSTASYDIAAKTIPGFKKDIEDSSMFDRLGVFNVPFTDIRLGTDKAQNLNQKTLMLLSQGQEILNSGVLNQNEIPILKGMIGDLTGIGSMVRDPKKTAAMVDNLSNYLKNKTESVATARGYTPKGGSLKVIDDNKDKTPSKNRVQDLLND
jgi:hypothetical protein